MKITIKDTTPDEEQVFECEHKRWFVSRLIEKAKSLPVQTMPIAGLNTYNLCPRPTTMNAFVSNIQRVLGANLDCPIILDDEGYVMDGRRRIAKALLEGKETIKFVRFEETPPHDYTVEDK